MLESGGVVGDPGTTTCHSRGAVSVSSAASTVNCLSSSKGDSTIVSFDTIIISRDDSEKVVARWHDDEGAPAIARARRSVKRHIDLCSSLDNHDDPTGKRTKVRPINLVKLIPLSCGRLLTKYIQNRNVL